MITDTDQLLSVAQFAKIVKNSPQLITHYIRAGMCRAIKLGGYYFIHQDEIQYWPPPKKKLGRPKKNV